MTAIISSTFEDQYLFYIPISTWLWGKLDVDVICFMPYLQTSDENKKIDLINDTFRKIGVKPYYVGFAAPEHKKATYAQCSRLYGACLELHENEVLITGDCDMGLFNIPDELRNPELITIFGYDLVPDKQYPMCYSSGTVKQWRKVLKLEYGHTSANPNEGMYLGIKSYQECLDELVGKIECEHFRGNQWSLDQSTLYNSLQGHNHIKLPRARPGTQFSAKRYDRDDSFILDRLNLDTIDYHFNRPGYEDKNFEIILKIIQWHYPNENLDWMHEYQERYKMLL